MTPLAWIGLYVAGMAVTGAVLGWRSRRLRDGAINPLDTLFAVAWPLTLAGAACLLVFWLLDLPRRLGAWLYDRRNRG